MIVIDYRETRLAADLPDAATASLGVGDVLIGDRVLLERKTPRDLDASISDGRWRDQLARMIAARTAMGYCLGVVVEGRVPPDPCWDHVRSAMAGAFVRDGVPCFEVAGPAELAQFVHLLSRRVDRNETASSQRALPRRGGGLMADPRRVAIAQLSVVSGVSDRVAETLLGECASMREWVVAWSEHSPSLRRRAFAAMGVAGGSRRIGPAVAARVDALVFGSEDA
eukprot:jgi/Tetstr1/447170/TSEL_034607.t1